MNSKQRKSAGNPKLDVLDTVKSPPTAVALPHPKAVQNSPTSGKISEAAEQAFSNWMKQAFGTEDRALQSQLLGQAAGAVPDFVGRELESFDHVAAALHGCIARYVRRPPIAKWRILKIANGQVEFVAKDTRNARLVPTRCTLDRFVRLLAAHVPDHCRHAIRYFGLLAPRTKGQHYAGLFLLLGQQRRPGPQRMSWRESVKKCFGFDSMIDS